MLLSREITDPPVNAKSDGKRQTARMPYTTPMRFAPYDGRQMPTFYAFQHGTGRDISTSGISFLAHEPPTTAKVILMLGHFPDVMYIEAEVRHYRMGCFERRMQYLVGCKFLRKLDSLREED